MQHFELIKKKVVSQLSSTYSKIISDPLLTAGSLAIAGLVGTIAVYKSLAPIKRIFTTKSFKGKVVVITGGGGASPKSLGRLLANDFAIRQGAKVVIWDLNPKAIEAVEKEIHLQGGFCKGYVCDITNYEQVMDCARIVEQEIGNVSVLINNAGVVQGKVFEECTEKRIRLTMEVNALSHFWTVKAFLPNMKKEAKNGGRPHIVTIGSAAGMIGTRFLTDYSASKFATQGFHQSLRQELHYGGFPEIDMTMVNPFFINTGMFGDIDTPWTAPILDPDFVCSRIVDAMKHRDYMIVLPKWMWVAYFFWWFAEQCDIDFVVEKILKLSYPMETFHKPEPPKEIEDKRVETEVEN